jgi:hypothetical protein
MNHEPAPDDVVPRQGTDADTLKKMLRQPVAITFPAEVEMTLDSCGAPLGINETAPAQTVTAILGTIRTHNQENQR